MISFTCDYSEGAHPLILEAFQKTNWMQEPGYGFDRFTASAREKIRAAAQCPDAEVFLLTGGTQTNATVIDGMLRGHEGVIAAETGHIAQHEAGAVEGSGHKVLTLPQQEGKIAAADLKRYLEGFYAQSAWEHMVIPGMVYLSFPTEYGTLYTRQELTDIRQVCRDYKLPLFVDGARLGYGLMSPACDLTLPELARLCDVFYIGGTKVGALCGEAVVFPEGKAPSHFFTHIKRHGALLAKGRLTGVQFDVLFTDGLYFEISRHAITQAMRLRDLFLDAGIPLYKDSPTNQQFPVLTSAQIARLKEADVQFEFWENLPDGRVVTRFATSWATSTQQLDALEAILKTL